MNTDVQNVQRVIGFDSHPDSFTAALLCGPTPIAAVVQKTFNKVPMSQLKTWAKKNTLPEDLFVLEASGNSFQVVRTLASIGRKALVLESCHLGKLKEAHANNDRISAVRIGKAYLAGTAKTVWVPDQKTQERRDVFHAHRKGVKRATQIRNRLLSYLSDNGVRCKEGDLSWEDQKARLQIQAAREWTARQWQVIEGLLLESSQAEQLRNHWRSLIAQEVLEDADLLSIVRLCGVRDVVAFALGAVIGDIHRFDSPKKLVKYLGLNPAFDDSGENQWQGGIGRGHGRKDLRCLLIESAHAILRCGQNPLAKWGKKLLARKGEIKLVVAAIARKLTVAVWHLMTGRWTPLEEIDTRLEIKIGKIMTEVAPAKEMAAKVGKTRRAYREEIYQRLKTGRVYVLDASKVFPSKPPPGSVAAENGLSSQLETSNASG